MSNGAIWSTHDHSIELSEAKKLTKNFRRTSTPDTILAGAFGKDAILSVLNQTDCAGIRVYFARTEDGANELVAVGVDGEGRDIFNGDILERIWPCPPYCDELSPLRGDL